MFCEYRAVQLVLPTAQPVAERLFVGGNAYFDPDNLLTGRATDLTQVQLVVTRLHHVQREGKTNGSRGVSTNPLEAFQVPGSFQGLAVQFCSKTCIGQAVSFGQAGDGPDLAGIGAGTDVNSECLARARVRG